MTSNQSSSPASRLCQICGLCCNGVMFHTVRLLAHDSPSELSALGLRLKRKRGHKCILQPCPALKDKRCTIYEHRPMRCRLFECQQLQRIASGEISEQNALDRIRDVQRRVTILERLTCRADGSPRKGPLAKRCEATLAEPIDVTTHPELATQRQELAHGFAELDAILDADFRLPSEN